MDDEDFLGLKFDVFEAKLFRQIFAYKGEGGICFAFALSLEQDLTKRLHCRRRTRALDELCIAIAL